MIWWLGIACPGGQSGLPLRRSCCFSFITHLAHMRTSHGLSCQVTFVDDMMRCTRGDRGELRIYLRDDALPDAASPESAAGPAAVAGEGGATPVMQRTIDSDA